jgi:transglutaminase-like putative cysteine protease
VPPRERLRVPHRRPEILLTLAVGLALAAAALPLLRVIHGGGWFVGGLVLAAVLLGVGGLCRRRRMPAVAVTGIELAIWVAVMTVSFLRDTAILLVVPSIDSLRRVPALVSDALAEIVNGAAPLSPGTGLIFLLVGALGLLAVILDHVVLTTRMPLLAAVGLLAVWLIPVLAVPTAVDVPAFAALAVAILLLLRAETRGRTASDAPTDRAAPASSSGGVAATAVGVGAIALVVAISVAPLLPPPAARVAGTLGAAATIDPSLELGEDLRRLTDVDVLTVRSTAPSPPYLRVATLSTFDGRVWQPDDQRTLPLEMDGVFSEVAVADEVTLSQFETTVDIDTLSSAWLPVSFPATAVEGLDGQWRAMPYNRTVMSENATTRDQEYRVTTQVPRPTREQIQASDAGGPAGEATYAIPADMPEMIAQTAQTVTAAAGNDYDRLVALQSWFRGDEFTYSLSAPVEEGFDGTGVDAIAAFLTQKEGYCVHFASSFAVMARSLGMPARIVVGYLPGTALSDVVDGQTVFQVTSDQLHSWPEVHFEGIGWVPFEPTKSLGSPTSFLPQATSAGGTADDLTADQSTADAATPSPTVTGPAGGPNAEDQALTGTSERPLTSGPGLAITLAVLVVLAAPAVIRAALRERRRSAAARGDAAAAWLAVREAAIDVGISVPASESPRAFGARLVARHGADEDAVNALVTAIERASYAPAGSAVGAASPDRSLAHAARTVEGALRASVPLNARVLASVLPRSLVMRPGSGYAAAAAP